MRAFVIVLAAEEATGYSSRLVVEERCARSRHGFVARAAERLLQLRIRSALGGSPIRWLSSASRMALSERCGPHAASILSITWVGEGRG